jgi:hypothetical protein
MFTAGTEKVPRKIDDLTRKANEAVAARGESRTELTTAPDLPKSFEGVWHIIASEVDDAEKLRALRLWASGEGIRDVENATGVKARALWLLIQRYGLAKLRYTTESLMALHKIAAHIALETIVARMLENPDDFKSKDLGVVAGISSDKLGSYEGWARGGARAGEDYASDLSKWGKNLMQSVEPGGKVKLELTVERQTDAIDVTSVPVETGSG